MPEEDRKDQMESDVLADQNTRLRKNFALLRIGDPVQRVFGFVEMNFHEVTGARGLPRCDGVDYRRMGLDDSIDLGPRGPAFQSRANRSFHAFAKRSYE